MNQCKVSVQAFLVLIYCLFVFTPLSFVHRAYAASCTPPPSGIISWWGGDDNALDMVGGNDGTLGNGATYSTGMVGEAFSLDGADDYVNLPDSASDLISDSTGTINVWVNPTSVGANVSVNNDIVAAFGTANAGEGAGIGVFNNVRIFHFYDTYDWQSSTPISANEWTMITYTWDDTTEKIYKNGVFSESRPRNFNYVPGHARVGNGWWGDPANAFPGGIDELTVFDRALDEAEIAAIYDAGSAGICKPCVLPPSGLLSWWPGDGDAADIVDAHDGVLVGDTTYATGKSGRAFSFDGSGDYVEMPASVGDLGSGDFTVDFWLRYSAAEAAQPNNYLLGKSDPNSGQGWDIRLNDGSGTNGKIVVTGVNGWDFNIYSAGSPAVDTWHHIALVGTTTTATLYIDGVPAGSSPRSTVGATSNPFRVGYTTSFGGSAFNGLIDEVHLYNSALTEDEIRGIYNAGFAGVCKSCFMPVSGLVSRWRAEGNANDSVGSNNGTLMGGAGFATGVLGQAFSLDGSDDYVEVPDSADLSFAPTAPMAITLWAYPTASDYHILGKRTTCYDSGQSSNYQLNSDLTSGLSFNSGGTIVSTGKQMALNSWHHVALSFDGATINMYIDGNLEKSQTATLGGQNTVPLAIGGTCAEGAKFSGLLDELAIYNRALTDDEITAGYSCHADTAPDSFSFTAVAGATRSTLYTSDTVTVSGINVPADIGITGGEYSIGCTGTFTSSAGTVVNGDTVCVRQTSSGNYSTMTAATLTIGGVGADFNVTTLAAPTYDITFSAPGGNGTISCDTPVSEGNNSVCTITPDTGYYLSALLDNGGDVLGAVIGGTYTIAGVSEAHTLEATFARYPVWRDGTAEYFMTIGAAYGDGSTGYTLKAHGVELTDSDLALSGTADMLIDGGYLPDFSGYSGTPTTITGPLTISGSGRVTISKIAVK